MCCNCEEASMNYSNGFQTYARPTVHRNDPCAERIRPDLCGLSLALDSHGGQHAHMACRPPFALWAHGRSAAGKPCRVGGGRKTSLYGCGINQNHIRNERT